MRPCRSRRCFLLESFLAVLPELNCKRLASNCRLYVALHALVAQSLFAAVLPASSSSPHVTLRVFVAPPSAFC